MVGRERPVQGWVVSAGAREAYRLHTLCPLGDTPQVKVNANGRAETVEELVARRKAVVLELFHTVYNTLPVCVCVHGLAIFFCSFRV